jgi:hypothetical protein
MPAGITVAHSLKILEDKSLPAKNLQQLNGFGVADETMDQLSLQLIILLICLRGN